MGLRETHGRTARAPEQAEIEKLTAEGAAWSEDQAVGIHRNAMG
jgi:hypothetical protein